MWYFYELVLPTDPFPTVLGMGRSDMDREDLLLLRTISPGFGVIGSS